MTVLQHETPEGSKPDFMLILISFAICHDLPLCGILPTAMGELLNSFKDGWDEARRPCRECRLGMTGANCRTCPHNRPKSATESFVVFACLIAIVFVFAIVAAVVA